MIKDIAIEIKGPTIDEGINTLALKCMKYQQHYRKLIFVLFSPKYSESNFKEIKKRYRENLSEFYNFYNKKQDLKGNSFSSFRSPVGFKTNFLPRRSFKGYRSFGLCFSYFG